MIKLFVIGLIFLSAPLITYALQTITQPISPLSNWWITPLMLFLLSLFLGIIAVLGGVGGGVLYVPIVSGFFPFHIDFVRATGLLVALAGSIAAGPTLLRNGMADLRFALPLAVIASGSAIAGALVGLALPAHYIQLSLGITILLIVFIMLRSKKSEFPHVSKPDPLSAALGINGVYYEESKKENVQWQVHNTPQGLISFLFIGFLAGMFGLGAGWANVPVLNLLMGAPLKISVSTSKFLLSITDTSAAWIYISQGAVIPLIVLPSIIGIMLGSRVGVKILAHIKPKQIRYLVISILLFSGVRAILKAFNI